MVVETRWHLLRCHYWTAQLPPTELLHCEGMQLHPARYLAFRHSHFEAEVEAEVVVEAGVELEVESGG